MCGNNVYFQPPTGKLLSYPCLIYELDNYSGKHADNYLYTSNDEYSITYITRDPDDAVIRQIAHLPLCRMTNSSMSDNLYHYYYKLYF